MRSTKELFIFISSIFWFLPFAVSQPLQTQLVKDISSSGSSLPFSLEKIGDQVFFNANDGINGQELWKSDGTEAGTQMVKDIATGVNGSGPNFLTNVNGTLFFAANNGVSGNELWKSDGTETGTVLVKDINPGPNQFFSSNPAFLTNVNGLLFFVANDGVNGFQLWKSDGTQSGTVNITSTAPTAISQIQKLINLNGTLIFVAGAQDGSTGLAIWKTDGTSIGTELVKIINSSSPSFPDFFTKVNNEIFFTANNGSNGNELWKTDGTPNGTTLVKDIIPGPGSSNPSELTNVNGELFFAANDGATAGIELWASDGTDAGTRMVKDIFAGNINSLPVELTNVNGTLFFRATDLDFGSELWKSDGTLAGTVLVKDIWPGSFLGSSPSQLTNINGQLLFQAFNGQPGSNIWSSDGTEAGTEQLDNVTNMLLINVFETININGQFFFSGGQISNGTELWNTSPTVFNFADVPPGSFGFQFIEDFFGAGVTGGCSAGNYCPNDPVTRAQMAVFLEKASRGASFTPPAATGVFNDVPISNPFAPWIEQLAADGITGGCGTNIYCPNDTVTRAQMAVFIEKALRGSGFTPPAATGEFTDVPVSDPFAPWIEQLANDNITGGCGGGNYCPNNPVTRAQMAIFMVKAFNLGFVE